MDNETTYCQPKNCSYCGSKDCAKNLTNAPHGCAVTVSDQSSSCKDFNPRYLIFAISKEEAIHKIRLLKEQHSDVTKFRSRIEIRGLTMDQVAKVSKEWNKS